MVIHKHGKYYNRVFKIDLTCCRCDCYFTIFGTWKTEGGGNYDFPDSIEKGFGRITYCPDCGDEISIDDEEPEIVDNKSEYIDTLSKDIDW